MQAIGRENRRNPNIEMKRQDEFDDCGEPVVPEDGRAWSVETSSIFAQRKRQCESQAVLNTEKARKRGAGKTRRDCSYPYRTLIEENQQLFFSSRFIPIAYDLYMEAAFTSKASLSSFGVKLFDDTRNPNADVLHVITIKQYSVGLQ